MPRKRTPGSTQVRILELADSPSSGSDLREAHRRLYGTELPRGGLHTTLGRLRDAGWLRVSRVCQTKYGPEKYYVITASGRRVLAQVPSFTQRLFAE